MSSNFFTDNDDLQYYFAKGLDWPELAARSELGFRQPGGFENAEEATEVYRQIADMVGGFSATEIAPRAAEIDRGGVQWIDGEPQSSDALETVFERMKPLELHGMSVPRELGGMSCPLVLFLVATELVSRADMSVTARFSFLGGVSLTMLRASLHEGTTVMCKETMSIVETRFAQEIGDINRGEAWGCMDITEPDAGSDMAALRASAERDENGVWRVSGSKIFITEGHAKYHLVIARTEQAKDPSDPLSGLAGLSLFLVRAFEDEDGARRRIVAIDRLEEKLGQHGSVTASLLFDRAPAEIVGEPGQGFRYMLMAMNHARLAIGFQALGLSEAAYRMARDYASGRPSMGKTIDKHEMIADYLDEMRTDIQGIRAMCMSSASAEGMAQQLDLELRLAPPSDELERKRLEARRKKLAAHARRALPLLKYISSEKCVEHARRCIQILGGNGYTTEYGAEKLLRDAMVMPIYEGTSQIQALMAMKDTLGAIMKNPQAFMKRRAQAHWRSMSAKDALERRVAKLQVLSLGAQWHLLTRTATTKLRGLQQVPMGKWAEAFKRWDPKRDFALAQLHAERLTRLLTDELIAELLLEQARRHPERRELCERWLDRCEPRCRFLHDEITSTGSRVLEQLHERAPTSQSA